MRSDREGADGRERISEQAAGEIHVGEGGGFLLDGPVTAKIGAVLDEKRDQFVVEIVTISEGGEDGGEARGGEGLHVLGAERGVCGEGDAGGFVGEGDEVVGDVGSERGVRGEGEADAGVVGLGELALQRGGEVGTRGAPSEFVGLAMGDEVEEGDGVGLKEVAGDAADGGVRGKEEERANGGGEIFARGESELNVFFVGGRPAEEEFGFDGGGGDRVGADDGAGVGGEHEGDLGGKRGLRGQAEAHAGVGVSGERDVVRETEGGVRGDGAADGGVGVLGELEEFAGGEQGVGGDVDADLRVFVGSEGREEVRGSAGIGGEVGEDFRVLRGLREVLEEMAGRKWIRGDKLLGGGRLGEFGEFLEEARGERGLAQGAGGLAHAVATDAFKEGGGGEGVGGQGGGFV